MTVNNDNMIRYENENSENLNLPVIYLVVGNEKNFLIRYLLTEKDILLMDEPLLV